MKNRSVVMLFILLSLTGGVLIYAVTRSESIYLNQWLGYIGNGKLLHSFQSLLLNSQPPQWIIYSLPDALWMLALVMLILMIWDFKLHNKSIPWVVIAVLTGILYEVFQGFHLIRGTFDVGDLILMVIGALLPLSFIMLKIRACKTN